MGLLDFFGGRKTSEADTLAAMQNPTPAVGWYKAIDGAGTWVGFKVVCKCSVEWLVQGRAIFKTGIYTCERCKHVHNLDAYLKEKGFSSDNDLPERRLVKQSSGPQAIMVGGGDGGSVNYDRAEGLQTVGWLK